MEPTKCFYQPKMGFKMKISIAFWNRDINERRNWLIEWKRHFCLMSSSFSWFLCGVRLLNFKIDHSSISVYEGVDYTEKRKELKQLIMNEVTSVPFSRRTRRGVLYEDPNPSHEESSKSQKVRAIVKLPSMFPHQVGFKNSL